MKSNIKHIFTIYYLNHILIKLFKREKFKNKIKYFINKFIKIINNLYINIHFKYLFYLIQTYLNTNIYLNLFIKY
jgi:hypothetical protein